MDFGKFYGLRIKKGGLVFIVMFVFLMLAALNTGNNLLYILMAGIVALFILSWLLARWSLRKVSLKREGPEATHREATFFIEMRLENHKRIMPSISLRIERHLLPGQQDKVAGYLLHLPARRAAILRISEVYHRRGVYHLPAVDLVTSFPFGLIEFRRRYREGQWITVYPRVIPVRTGYVEQLPGGVSPAAAVDDDGDEFYSLREYVPGDEIRRVAWRISARLGKWMVRELARGQVRSVMFILDTRVTTDVDHFSQHFEESIEWVASLSAALIPRQYKVGLCTPDNTVEIGHGHAQQHRILEALARIDLTMYEDHPDFDRMVSVWQAQQVKVILISPDPNRWGEYTGTGIQHYFDPREIVHA